MTYTGYNEHRSPTEVFKTLKRDDKKYVTPYGGSTKTRKSDQGTSWTPERGSSVKAPAEQHKTPHGYSNISLK